MTDDESTCEMCSISVPDARPPYLQDDGHCSWCGETRNDHLTSAPHPAPDATEHNLTQVEQRALHKALLASGKVLYRFSAPDATYGERLLEAAREMQAIVSAPDATDWKALCGAAVMERNAAQAENEKLRELASRTYDHLHELTAIIPYNPHNDVAYRITTDLMASLRAAISPPPLSPEKP